jgi:hypothetical protein
MFVTGDCGAAQDPPVFPAALPPFRLKPFQPSDLPKLFAPAAVEAIGSR